MQGWLDGWRHWLTKYINKESTFHNIATFNFTQPSLQKSSSDTLGGTISISTTTYVGMVV